LANSNNNPPSVIIEALRELSEPYLLSILIAALPLPNLCSDLKDTLRVLSSNKFPLVLVRSYFNSLNPYQGNGILSGVSRMFAPPKASL
jgi:hypothetical protein